MKDKITKFIKYEAAFWVAIFLLFFVSAIAVNTIIKTTSVRAAESLTELQKKKKLEEERAKKAKELKELKEKQAQAAVSQAQFLSTQIEQIKKQEEQTVSSISSTEQEITQLQGQIGDVEQQEAEQKRKTMEIAKIFFEQRRELFIDSENGSALDVLAGGDISESFRHKNKIEAALDLLRERTSDLIVVRLDLGGKKDSAQDKHTQLTTLKDEQTRLRRARQTSQNQYERLASQSQTQAEAYQTEMEKALSTAATYESKIREELTRIINARKKSGAIPRTGASVGQSVTKGEIIGHQGNTGYSFGSHLHFEVREDNIAVNPRNHLGKTLDYPFDSEYRITQEFGVTPYSKQLYSSGIHTGIDFAKYDGANVQAACSGEIIMDDVYGGYGRAFAHTCDNTDLVVLYGHLQPE